MTIAEPQISVEGARVNTTTGNINNSQETVKLSDGSFVVVHVVAGDVKFQQFDAFGNKIGVEGGIALEDSALGVTMSVVAVEDNKLVIANETTNDIYVAQSFSLVDGVLVQTEDIDIEFDPSPQNTADLAPSLSGSTTDDLALHVFVSQTGVRDLVTITDLNGPVQTTQTVATAFNSNSVMESTLRENGNRVVVIDTNAQGGTANRVPTVVILASDGTQITSFVTGSDGANTMSQPRITALAGGGFVVVFSKQDGDQDVVS